MSGDEHVHIINGMRVRHFRASDWIGQMIECPHCWKVLKCVAAYGPYEGINPYPEFAAPTPHDARDVCWTLKLSDGACARMWEHRQGVILGPAE